MSDPEIRDAHVGVEIELPNGTFVRGKPIPWREGMKIKALLLDFIGLPSEENFRLAFGAFEGATGLTAEVLHTSDPDMTLGEMVDFMNRFTYLLRPGRSAAGNQATPGRIAPSSSPAASPSA
jgi:hypothetical protein